ncbi:hypothetical protein BV22DRAFT_1200360 [Leucogyrophana mollusca]|uniref:Uncharacterized protein n=1 Tax=Leucogyrophana mollusca TaxID=85980 RepID=A0ACB8AUX2_9AGAM|nr:hypothetical protein BV22DRAFT_1200360 [Leucogyrophana mollusca]
MLFRPAAILIATGICATRVVAWDGYDITFFTGPMFNGSAEHHYVEIGTKYPGDKLACGSCKDITKIPTGKLHSWSLGASCNVNLRFYGKKGCKSILKSMYVGESDAEPNVHDSIVNARSFEACRV